MVIELSKNNLSESDINQYILRSRLNSGHIAEKAAKKHELINLLKEYKYCGKNEAELTKETIARLMQNFL